MSAGIILSLLWYQTTEIPPKDLNLGDIWIPVMARGGTQTYTCLLCASKTTPPKKTRPELIGRERANRPSLQPFLYLALCIS